MTAKPGAGDKPRASTEAMAAADGDVAISTVRGGGVGTEVEVAAAASPGRGAAFGARVAVLGLVVVRGTAADRPTEAGGSGGSRRASRGRKTPGPG